MNVQLSKRMQAVADMALPGFRVADIGCDHGFVSIYLIQNRIAPYVYAADVRPGPLERAKEHIAAAGLEKCICAVLSDGLAQVPVENERIKEADNRMGVPKKGAQAVIAAGIGGRLTIKILNDWPEKTQKLSWMVLEPQSDIHLVRSHLLENGFFLLKEDMVFEDGKFYPILFAVNEGDIAFAEKISCGRQLWQHKKACWTAAGYSETDWQRACEEFGFWTITDKNPVLKDFLEHRIQKEQKLLAEMDKKGNDSRLRQRMDEIGQQIALCRLVLEFMNN